MFGSHFYLALEGFDDREIMDAGGFRVQCDGEDGEALPRAVPDGRTGQERARQHALGANLEPPLEQRTVSGS